MPPLMSNHGNFIVSLGDVCRYLARKAEALGVEIYPGFAAAEVLFENDAVAGIATGDMGIAKDGQHKAGFARGMELRGKYTLFAEGARGSLSKVLIERFALGARQRAAEIRHRPQGALAGRARQAPQGPGPAYARLAARQSHRRRLVPLSLRRQSGGGRLRRASQLRQSVSVAVRGISALQDPSADPRHCSPAASASATAPAPSPKAAGSRCRSLAFPGGALIGCAAGFVNVPRIKGSHNAMLSGMLAAEHVAAALGAGRANDELAGYENAWRASPVGRDLWRVRNAKPLWSKFGTFARRRARRARHVDQHARLLAVRHAQARQARLRDAASLRRNAGRIAYAKPDGKLTFDGCRRSICPTPTTRRTSRCIFWCATPLCRNRPSTTSMPVRRRAIARPASMNGSRRAGKPRFVINAQNCVHCKTCDIKDPNQNITWVPPEGGGGPNYPNM